MKFENFEAVSKKEENCVEVGNGEEDLR